MTDHTDRLKKVQGKKKRDTEAAENKRKADLAAAATAESEETEGKTAAPPSILDEEPSEGTGDLLNDKDADVIF